MKGDANGWKRNQDNSFRGGAKTSLLNKGFEDLEKQKHSVSKGFTLAEVLITIGIIGVVAALTLPGLIQNYRKKVISTKLEKTYSEFAQVFKNAEVDNGDMAYWITDLNKSVNATGSSALMAPFIKQYIMPYLKGATCNEDKPPISDLGFTNGIKLPNGTTLFQPSANAYSIKMNNGIVLLFSLLSYTMHGEKVYNALAIYICLNGGNPNATLAKDVHVFNLNFLNNEFSTYACTHFADKDVCRHSDSLEDIWELCRESGHKGSLRLCTNLIQRNNWEIPKDYPYKF